MEEKRGWRYSVGRIVFRGTFWKEWVGRREGKEIVLVYL